jgi:hypothetical protein
MTSTSPILQTYIKAIHIIASSPSWGFLTRSDPGIFDDIIIAAKIIPIKTK